MDFINNDGSYAHRGVWHITDNLTSEHHAASTTEREWRTAEFIQYVKPEYIDYRGDAICGQVKGMRQGGLNWGKAREIDGQHSVITYRAKRPDIVIGLDGYIPGPLCSRCAKKAGIEDRL